MESITYTAARKNLGSMMDKVCSDHAAVVITRKCAPSVVMLSLEDYESMEETAYLLASPVNARRLSDAIESLEGSNSGAWKVNPGKV